MCQSASIVSRMLCRGCRHVSRKALQSPTTRSVTTTNKKARGTAKGMSKHNSKACPQPGRHAPKPSKIKVRVDLGRQKIVPETSPTRHGTPTSAHKGPKSRPRSGQGGPRAAHDRPKASQGAPEMCPRGSQAAAKPSPASPKTHVEHDLRGQLFLTRSSIEFCSFRASRVLRVMRFKHSKKCSFVTCKAFQQCTRRENAKATKERAV